MGKALPRIVVDTREQRPLRFGGLPVTSRKLDFGDYSLRGLECRVAVERKSMQDLWGTVSQSANLDRFEREMDRAQLAGCRLHVLVECTPAAILRPSRFCAMDPRRVLDRLWEACHRHGAAATFACGRADAAAVALAILRGAWRAEQSWL